MRGHWAIDGRDHRHFDTDDVFEDLRALAEDLVESGGREEIETFGRDLGAELIARPGQDDDVVIGIIADVTERPNQRFVHVAVEHEWAASRMQGDLQDAVFPLHFHVVVFISVAIEHGHAPLLDDLAQHAERQVCRRKSRGPGRIGACRRAP